MDENEVVFPDYTNSILNLIGSILKYYNVDTKFDGINELNKELEKKYKNVVLIILDGLGNKILSNISPNGFFIKNYKKKITSVYPSTTAAAMTTYYSGKPPIETRLDCMVTVF